MPQRRLEFRTPLDIEKAKLFGSLQFTVLPARLLTADGWAFGHCKGGIYRRTLQNVGTVAVKYWLIGPVNDDDTLFDPAAGSPELTDLLATQPPHGILAPGTANDDGFGALVDLQGFGHMVYIEGSGGAPRVLTFEAYDPIALSFTEHNSYKTIEG